MSKRVMHMTPEGDYKSDGGHSLKREYGKTPNGNDLNGLWVYRNSLGAFKDFGRYRNDIAERNHLELK